MKIQTEKILSFLQIISWIMYGVAALILGIQVISFLLSFVTQVPLFGFQDLDKDVMQKVHTSSLFSYSIIVLLAILVTFLKLKVVEKIRNSLSKMNIQKPFTSNVVENIESATRLLFFILVIESFRIFCNIMFFISFDGLNRTLKVDFTDIFLIGIVFIISQIFKRGVELQEENELTV